MALRHHEPTRLEGFSDGIFAIALALLVVSLEVPKTMTELEEMARGFLPFALMFAMVCWVWYEHNKFFRRYGMQDAWTTFLNCILLFVVLFYVYPLKFLTMWLLGGLFRLKDAPRITEMGQVQTLMLLYSGGIVLIFLTFILLYHHAWRRRRQLNLNPVEELHLRFGMRAHVLSVGLGVTSILLTLSPVGPMFAGMIYILMGPLHAWNGYAMGAAMSKLERLESKNA